MRVLALVLVRLITISTAHATEKESPSLAFSLGGFSGGLALYVKDGVLSDQVAAISCGLYKGTPVLDLDYAEANGIAVANIRAFLAGQPRNPVA